MKRTIYAVAAAILVWAIADAAWAGGATLSWQAPTQYDNNTAIPATGTGALSGYTVEYGQCASATAAWPATVSTLSVTAPATTVTVNNLIDGQGYCFRVKALTNNGGVSSPSNMGFKLVPALAPKPPVLLTVDTVAYSVAADWASFKFVKSQAVGTVNLGTACASQNVGGGFHSVPRTAVRWTSTSRPSYVVALCG